jgi:hypothetical protein
VRARANERERGSSEEPVARRAETEPGEEELRVE